MPTKKHKKTVAVIIPFYKDTLTNYEAIALEQCFKVLHAHPVIAIKPNHLILPPEVNKYPFTEVIDFDNHYFANIAGYNELMLSENFYGAFLEYKYMLIYQLDAFVFKDELKHWCDQGYDYIGAPWLKAYEHGDMIKTIKSNITYYFHIRYNIWKDGEPSKYQYENRIGNGGFSLRKIEKFYNACIKYKATINEYLNKGTHHFNEDRFWSIEVNRKRRTLNIPGYHTGIKFSVEIVPERAFRLNNNLVPFGCHAWDKNVDFWRAIFKSYGYII
jgi:hypothetical protein